MKLANLPLAFALAFALMVVSSGISKAITGPANAVIAKLQCAVPVQVVGAE